MSDPTPRPNARGRRTRREDFDPPTLRVLRTDARMSREKLAEEVGTSVSSGKMWETGARVPTLATAARLAEALGVDPDALRGTTERFDPAQHTLRAIRSRYQLSVGAVAAATGASDDTVQAVESARRLPPDSAIWAKAYRITQAQLMAAWALSYQHTQQAQASDA